MKWAHRVGVALAADVDERRQVGGEHGGQCSGQRGGRHRLSAGQQLRQRTVRRRSGKRTGQGRGQRVIRQTCWGTAEVQKDPAFKLEMTDWSLTDDRIRAPVSSIERL